MPATIDIKTLVEKVGGETAIELTLRRFDEDVNYLQSVRHILLQKYVDQWIAIYQRNLVAHGKSATELRRKLEKKAIPANEAVIDFMASERKAMLL